MKKASYKHYLKCFLDIIKFCSQISWPPWDHFFILIFMRIKGGGVVLRGLRITKKFIKFSIYITLQIFTMTVIFFKSFMQIFSLDCTVKKSESTGKKWLNKSGKIIIRNGRSMMTKNPQPKYMNALKIIIHHD